MPTGSANETRFRARSLGPALPSEPRYCLRVHSVFRGALNLRFDGQGSILTLTGPAGSILPHAIALESNIDFREWPLEPGSPGEWMEDSLRLHGARGAVRIDCGRAHRRDPWPLPKVEILGGAYGETVRELVRIQRFRGTELRFDLLSDSLPDILLSRPPGFLPCEVSPATAMAEALARAARALEDWSHIVLRGLRTADEYSGPESGEAIGASDSCVQGLLGLGPGLSPAGDDFLCGFIGAAQCSAAPPAYLSALNAAVERGSDRTNGISASLLSLATRGFFPEPLARLAQGLARDDTPAAVSALRELCSLGHSSGCDIASGLLFGLAAIAHPEPIVPS